MKKKSVFLSISLVFLSAIIMAPPFVFGYEAMTVIPQEKFSEEELDQMLAPIALYPDSLLAQMMMAATYPLEVVEAARWVSQHPDLKGELLGQALLEKNWHVSVKSLAHYPRVLSMMGEEIEWTTRLGIAFLAQKDEVMDTIQGLRADAEAALNPRPTPEQEAGCGPYPPPPPVYSVHVAPVEVPPSFPSILCDIIFLRPAGVAALGLGLGATVVTMPFALPSGSMGQVSQKLIVGPFDFTFLRPLGTWRTWEITPPER